MRGISSDSSSFYDELELLKSNRYNLEVQILLDYNDICDSIHISTKTVFDPYSSFYYFETSRESQVFINIYFDLIEIERRKLELEISQVIKDYQLVEALYNKAKERIESLKERYFRDVQRGLNVDKMREWNEVVYESLNINNFEIFGIE